MSSLPWTASGCRVSHPRARDSSQHMATGVRIAIVAPADDCVPSRADHATGNGIKALADALVMRGHTVLVCAPIPSHSDARVVGTVGYRGSGHVGPDVTLAHLMRAVAALERFKPDVTHDFTGHIGLLDAGEAVAAALTVTAAEPLPTMQPELMRNLAERRSRAGAPTALVAQTTWVQERIRGIAWDSVIPPAVTVRDAVFAAAKLPCAVYVGPLSPGGGVLAAVQAARALGLPLRIARRHATPAGDAYLFNHVSTHLGAEVEVVEVSDSSTGRRLLADAGLLITTPAVHARSPHTAVRALASGTPVLVAAAPTDPTAPIVDGSTVMQVTFTAMSPQTATHLRQADAYECRRRAAVTFGPDTTAAAYEQIYKRLLAPAGSRPLSIAGTT